MSEGQLKQIFHDMVTRECFSLYRPFSGEAGFFAACAFVNCLEIHPFFVNSEKLFLLSEKKVNLRVPPFTN
jgi:hypothetical protein